MNKQEFAEQLAKKTKLSKKLARAVLDGTLGLIVESTRKGDKVAFTGFGTFEPYQRKASTRINPQTRQRIQVPAKRVPKFRAGKHFKQAVSR